MPKSDLGEVPKLNVGAAPALEVFGGLDVGPGIVGPFEVLIRVADEFRFVDHAAERAVSRVEGFVVLKDFGGGIFLMRDDLGVPAGVEGEVLEEDPGGAGRDHHLAALEIDNAYGLSGVALFLDRAPELRLGRLHAVRGDVSVLKTDVEGVFGESLVIEKAVVDLPDQLVGSHALTPGK